MNSLLPRNASPAERAIEAATARLADVPVPLRDLWNPQTCPEALLPWLAWALSIDSWKSYWPVEIKRARVAAALDIQRRKGSVQSVRDVVLSFGGAVDIVEWWQQSPRGTPRTFHLSLALSGIGGETATADYVDDVIAEVSRTKPVGAHFDFTQIANLYGAIGVAGVLRPCLLVQLQFTAEAA